MARLRTLVAAGWVVVTIAGPVTGAPSLTARGTADAGVVSGAGAIDATGATDVTADLQALIDRTPDGGVVELERDGDYRVDGTLVVDERHELRIEGNGARIFATTTGDFSRSHLRITGGSDLIVRDIEIEGANPHAGLDDRGYVPELEGQHGIRVEGVTDLELVGVHVHATYGDLVLVSRHEEDRRWSERVWIHDSTFERSGRQGITVGAGRDIVIERNRLTDMRRATVDLEPTAKSWGADNVHILDNQVGPGRLLFVAAAGDGPVNRVVIARNTLRGRPLTFYMFAEDGARRQRAWVVDNTSDAPITAPPLRFTRVDGVVVHGNRQPIDEAGVFVRSTDSCDVSISANDTAPGARLLEGRTRECNFILPVEPPSPPPVAGRGQSTAPAPQDTSPPTTSAGSSTTAPSTAAPPGTTSSTGTSSPPTTQAAAPGTQLAAAERRGGDGVAGPVVILAMALSAAAGAGAAAAVNARRGRR
jgi:hypothetical protein